MTAAATRTRIRAWAVSGVLAPLLFLSGLISSDILVPGRISERYPVTTDSLDKITRYVTTNEVNVRATSALHSLAAVSLLLFAVTVSRILRGVEEPEEPRFSAVALAGGQLAATLFILSALFGLVVVLPTTTDDPPVLMAVLTLRQLLGGLFYLLAMSVFVGTTSLAALRTGLYPGWLAYAGLVVAALCLWSVVGQLTLTGAAELLYLLGLPLSMLWLLVAGTVLATGRG